MLRFKTLKYIFCSLLLMGIAMVAHAQNAPASTPAEKIDFRSASGFSRARFPASNVLDNDLSFSSRFTSRTHQPDELFLDLGDVWRVEDIKIAWGNGDRQTYEFEIATRTQEEENWSIVYRGQSSGTTEQFETYDVTDARAQFIRIHGLSNSRGTSWTEIIEVQAYGRNLSQILREEIDIKSASGLSRTRFPAVNVLDDNLGSQSRFTSRTNQPNELFLDLGDVWGVDDLKIAWGNGNQQSYEFEIGVRTREEDSWSTIYHGNSSGMTDDFETYEIKDSEAQFIRIHGLSNSSGTEWTDIIEVKAYGRPVPQDKEITTTLEHFGEPITLVGANIPWSSDSGFSADFGWYSPTDISGYRRHFNQIQTAGGNSARVWLHTTGQVTPNINPDGVVIGLSRISSDAVVIDQLKSVLDEAWERGVVVTFSLFSYDMFCDSYGDDFGYRSYRDIERHRMMVEENYQSYIDEALLPIVNGLKDHPGLFAYEVFNEPEGAIQDMTGAGHFCPDEPNVPGDGLSFPLSLAGAQKFVNRVAAAVHEADPNVKITSSTHTDFFDAFSNQTLTSQRGADPDGTLDFYELHHYPLYENAPYITNANVYDADRPIIIGEYDLEDVQQESLFRVESNESLSAIINNGYSGAWSWSLIDDDFGDIPSAISSVPDDVKALDRAAVEACIQSRDAECYRR